MNDQKHVIFFLILKINESETLLFKKLAREIKDDKQIKILKFNLKKSEEKMTGSKIHE